MERPFEFLRLTGGLLVSGFAATALVWMLRMLQSDEPTAANSPNGDYMAILADACLLLIGVLTVRASKATGTARAASFALAMGILLPLLWFGWPTPWTYYVRSQQSKAGHWIPVRTRLNLFSGKKQSFLQGEWIDGTVIVD